MRRLKIDNVEPLRVALKQIRCQSANTRLLYRLTCLLLVAQGMSCYQVAAILDRDPRTVARWVQRYLSGGLKALEDKDHCGRRPRLDSNQLERLKSDLTHAPGYFGYRDPWSGYLLAHHLKLRYEVVLSVRQCQRLLCWLRP